MSIFDISEKTDFFFDKMWRIWPQSWNGLGQSKAYEFCQQIIDRMIPNGDMWQSELCYAVAATLVGYNDNVPPEIQSRVRNTVFQLATLIQKVLPDFPYMYIRVGSNVSGGDHIFCPNIDIGLDTKFFGYDPSIEDSWKRHIYPGIHFHLGHKPDLYYRDSNGVRGLPYPKAGDWVDLKQSCFIGGQRLQDEYFFFPENDPPKGWYQNLTSKLLKFQSQASTPAS